MRAAIYTRVSTSGQADQGTSLESQLHDCHKLGVDLGAEVVAEYRDVDSGASWDLPGLLDLLDAAKDRQFEIVLCYDPDRLSRDLAKQLLVRHDLERAGVTLRYVTLRVEQTAEGRLLENVRAVIAEYERAKIAARMSRGRRHKATSGNVVGGGSAPYGYQFTRDLTGRVVNLEPDESAVVVRRIYQLALTHSLRAIADLLETDNVPTYRGGARWASTTILDMLKNPTYRGAAEFGRRGAGETIVIPCPPLVSDADWYAAQAALDRRRNTERRARRANDPFLLRSRLTCAYCGRTLACLPTHRGRYYQCLGSVRSRVTGALCPLPALPAKAIEEHVEQLIFARLLNPTWLHQSLKSAQKLVQRDERELLATVRGLERQQLRLRQQLRQTTERLATLPVDSERYRAADAHAAALERSLADLEAQIVAARDAPAVQEQHDTRRTMMAFVRELLERIANYSDRDLVEIIQGLDLRGTVRDDPNGEPLGRRYRWVIAWSTAAGVLHGVRGVKTPRARFYTPDYAEWEDRNLTVEQPA